MSLANSRRVARFLGRISWQFAHKNRQVALTNISRCFPELSHEEQVSLAKDSINATIMNMMELGKIWDKKLDINTLIEQATGLDEFKQALSLDQGLLLAVPHMGNWEVLNLVMARFDKYAFLYKAPSDKTLEKKLIEFRGKSNALQIEANLKGVRKIMVHLKGNGFVGILPDQRPKQGQGVFTPFYNIPTYTMSLFSKLAIKTKVPVFFAYVLRSDKGFKIYFEKSGEQIYSNLESSVTYMNAKIQEIVDKAPEQYQWTYKRFSIQPDSEQQPFYKKRP